MSDVLEISKKINKAWKSDVLTPGNLIPQCPRFSMGTLSSDYALYGGLPEGKLVVYAGETGSGKSLAACLAVAQYQRVHPDKVCIYVDAEETLVGQVEWLQKMTGLILDGDHFLRYDCTGKAAEEIFDDLKELQQADNIGLIVIDSAPMLMTRADMDAPISKDNGQRASIAKPLGKFIKAMLQPLARAKNTLLIINHIRLAGTTFTGAKIYTEPCGYSLDYYPCMKVRFAKSKCSCGDKLDIAQTQQDADTDGIVVTFSVTKNRLGPRNRNGAKIVFRYETGVDTITDLIEIITTYEIAKRLSTVTWQLVNPLTGEPYLDAETGKELTFAGKAKMVDYIKTHDAFRAEYEQAVSDYINKNNTDISLIDEEDLQTILEADKSIEQFYAEMSPEEKNLEIDEGPSSNNEETKTENNENADQFETVDF